MRTLVCTLLAKLVFASLAMADFTVFNIEPFFDEAVSQGGFQLDAFEGFENNNLGPDDGTILPIEPLQFGVPLLIDGKGFPNGLSNDLVVLNPLGSNVNAQWALFKGGNFGGQDNSAIVFGEGIEFDFTTSNVTAVNLEVRGFFSSPVDVVVFDGAGEVVFDAEFDAVASFFGVTADQGDSISKIIFTPDVG